MPAAKPRRCLHYPAVLVSLDRLLFAAAEAPLVHELGQLLLHQLLNLGDGLLETVLARAGDVKVERRILTQRT